MRHNAWKCWVIMGVAATVGYLAARGPTGRDAVYLAVGRSTHLLPYVLTLIGGRGGAIAFGARGSFLGPVLLALGLAVAEEFAGQPRGSWRQG